MHKHRLTIIIAILLVVVLGAGYVASQPQTSLQTVSKQLASTTQIQQAPTQQTDEDRIRGLITRFAAELQMITSETPKTEAVKMIQDHYAPFVSPGLLSAWESDPIKAPARLTQNPADEQIDIALIERDEDGAYEVQAKVIAKAGQYMIAIKLRYQNERWVMTGFTKIAR